MTEVPSVVAFKEADCNFEVCIQLQAPAADASALTEGQARKAQASAAPDATDGLAILMSRLDSPSADFLQNSEVTCLCSKRQQAAAGTLSPCPCDCTVG